MPAGQREITPEAAGERFHRLLYLAVQRLRRRPLGAYIRKLREWERLGPEAFQALRAERLSNTLAYARSRVPLYRSKVWQDAFQRGSPGDLRTWPVLEREIVQAHEDQLLAQPTPRGRYFRSTSGSTGKPLRVWMDPPAATWAWASDYRGLLWHGIRVGALALTLRPRTAGALGEWIRHNHLVPATDLSPARLTKAVDFLQTRKPTYVWGYVSAVVELARHAGVIAADAPRPLVPYVKVFGEMLYPFQRKEIEDGLGARVIETYGCNETGTVAYECPAGSLHVFSEHVELEILNDGEPAGPGELGDIVLTCLTNRVMPLIRYRVGDRGRLSPVPCSCGRPHPAIYGIEGRAGDLLLTTTGARVHGTAALGLVLKKILGTAPASAIGRVLFEQHDPRTWTVLVQKGPGFNENLIAALQDGVRAVFGQECRVTVKPVSEIPRDPSGKFRFYRGAPSVQT
jgi:phenylacetate-CoA ligase